MKFGVSCTKRSASAQLAFFFHAAVGHVKLKTPLEALVKTAAQGVLRRSLGAKSERGARVTARIVARAVFWSAFSKQTSSICLLRPVTGRWSAHLLAQKRRSSRTRAHSPFASCSSSILFIVSPSHRHAFVDTRRKKKTRENKLI